MRFGQRIVNLKRLQRVNFRRVVLRVGEQFGLAEQVAIGYSGVSLSVFGVKTDRLSKILISLQISFGRALVPEVAPFRVGFISGFRFGLPPIKKLFLLRSELKP